jgi:probable rRNA maturation factor
MSAPRNPGASPNAVRLELVNRQRACRVNTTLLRRIAEHVVGRLFPEEAGTLELHLIGRARMAGLNRQFLGHIGPTDVLTFDYSGRAAGAGAGPLAGEILLCPAVARGQARQFGVSWQAELTRYLVHGMLHLAGENDARPRDRQAMKKKENLWMQRLGRLFPLSKLSLGSRLPGHSFAPRGDRPGAVQSGMGAGYED